MTSLLPDGSERASMENVDIVVVSADPAVRDSLSTLISSAGMSAEIFPSLQVWLDAIRPEHGGCLLLDAGARELTDPGQLERFASVCATRSVVLLIERGDVPVAVRAIKGGAADVLEKPVRDDDLLQHLERAIETDRLARVSE